MFGLGRSERNECMRERVESPLPALAISPVVQDLFPLIRGRRNTKYGTKRNERIQSVQSDYVNGTTIFVDGGMFLYPGLEHGG